MKRHHLLVVAAAAIGMAAVGSLFALAQTAPPGSAGQGGVCRERQ